jgi:raffinose/stachyose/melibiose transport system permease protein
MKRPRLLDMSVRYAVLGLASVLTLLPLVIVALVALFKPGTPITGVAVPSHPTFSAFPHAWDIGAFGQALRTSGVVSIAVVLIVTTMSILAGYAFGTMKFRGSSALFYLMLAGMTVPFNVMIVPLYFQFQSLRLADTYWGLILPESGIYLAFGVFWMRAYFLAVPRALIEAARIEGASSFRILWQILVPIGKPAILTLMMLTFLASWNEYLVPLVMSSSNSLQTVPLRLANFQGQYVSDIPSLAAASLIVAGPAVIVYVFTQRTFFRGLLHGAIK